MADRSNNATTSGFLRTTQRVKKAQLDFAFAKV
jgi:hypothetical protein